jgi:predicted RecA/RadA family phage recombinase
MTWTTTDIATNDIIQQDGVFAYNFKASGAIKKGQALYLSADNLVSVTTASATESNCCGFATMDAANGEQVGVAGPGNIVVCCMDDAASVAGTALYGDTDGVLDATAGNATKVAGYIVDRYPSDVSGSVAATNHVIKLLAI